MENVLAQMLVKKSIMKIFVQLALYLAVSLVKLVMRMNVQDVKTAQQESLMENVPAKLDTK